MAGTAETQPKKKGLGPVRITIIVICAIAAAGAAGYLIYHQVQMNIADRLTAETLELYTDGTRDIDGSPAVGGSADADGTNSSYINDYGDIAPGSGTDDAYGGDYGAYGEGLTWDDILAVNPNVCGWIYVPAIPSINYPIVHYSDNDYYLRRAWTGEYLVSGSIMLDYNCSPDWTDLNNIVYGHNMNNGTMFGSLKQFRQQDFYLTHDNRVIIYTPDSTMYYTIFSVHIIVPTQEGVYLVGFERDSEYENYIFSMKEASDYETYVNADKDDNILTLSTCAGSDAAHRLVIHAKMTEAYGAITETDSFPPNLEQYRPAAEEADKEEEDTEPEETAENAESEISEGGDE